MRFCRGASPTVRDPAARIPSRPTSIASRSNRARASGPRLLTTGEPFDGTRIYYPGGSSLDDTWAAADATAACEGFRLRLRENLRRLPDLMQKRDHRIGARMGMPVTSHELYPAVAYGADGVEHIRGTSRRGYSPKITALIALVSGRHRPVDLVQDDADTDDRDPGRFPSSDDARFVVDGGSANSVSCIPASVARRAERQPTAARRSTTRSGWSRRRSARVFDGLSAVADG